MFEIVAGRRRFHAALAVAAEAAGAGIGADAVTDGEDAGSPGACAAEGAAGCSAGGNANRRDGSSRRKRGGGKNNSNSNDGNSNSNGSGGGSGGAEADGAAMLVPCAIIEAGDDAAALEASLIENVAREAPHEVEQWATFTRLVKEGRSAEDLGLTFGLTAHQVRQVLSLGNLLPRIRELYRKGEIDGGNVRLLTMASTAQQKDWLALLADPDSYTPLGSQLRAWLFGGAAIATRVALFDLDTFPGEIVSDLFGEGGYFASADQFWEAQNAAIEARRQAYLQAGWSEVVTLGPNDYFQSWDFEKAARTKGGKIIVDISPRGEVTFHEGLLSRREAAKLRRSGDGDEGGEKPVRPEVTGPLQNYIDLHRHAAVRTALLDAPQVALRLLTAHVIAGSHLFAVRPEPQRGASNAIAESIETCLAETRFDARRRAVLARLGFDPDAPTVIGGAPRSATCPTASLFAQLLPMSDEDLFGVITVVMGEALEAGSAAAELTGQHLGVEMASCWQADDAFFDLLRDKAVLAAMVGELAGEAVARANADEKAKGLKAIVRDCLAGTNGRSKVEHWVPRWMRFAPSAYTERGGVGTCRKAREIAPLLPASDMTAPGEADDARAVPDERQGAAICVPNPLDADAGVGPDGDGEAGPDAGSGGEAEEDAEPLAAAA